jgi:5-methylcytosine-specific restriction protein A
MPRAQASRSPWQHERASRHARGYGTEWDKVRKVVLERDKGLCQVCLRDGRVTGAKTVDHIKPKAQGGTDDPANLQVICASCHLNKTLLEQGKRRKRRIGVNGYPIDD